MFSTHKAGLEGVDKAEVNRIIEEASRGTPFWEHQQRRKERHAERIQNTLQKIAAASSKEMADAKKWAKSTLRRLDTTKAESACYIVHVDLDAFYASVEERDNTRLRDVPMAVGSSSMLSTSNYAARKFGVRAGLPGFIAKKLCPQLVIVPVNLEKYRQASAEVMSILHLFDPHLTVFGLDEAALDLTEYCLSTSDGVVSPDEAVNRMRNAVRETTGLTCSAGIAPNGLLAKICADVNKPDGQFCLESPEDIENFLAPLEVRKIPGIGQVQEKILSSLGIETCGDLLENGDRLLLAFGENSAEAYLRAAKGVGSTFGQDDRKVRRPSRKSKSAEATFRESTNPAFLADVVRQLCERLSEDLVASKLSGRLLTLKIKMASFDVFSRSISLEIATNDGLIMTQHAQRILRYILNRRQGEALRLLGVKMSNFDSEQNDAHSSGRQTTLSQVLSKSWPNKLSPKKRDCGNTNMPTNVSAEVARVVGVATSNKEAEDTEGDEKAEGDDVQQTRQQVTVELIEQYPQDVPNISADKITERQLLNTPAQIQATYDAEDLIEETYCPICAVIMRGITERHASRHVNECLQREQRRDLAVNVPLNGVASSTSKSGGLTGRTTSKTHSQKSNLRDSSKRKGNAIETKDENRRAKQPAFGPITAYFSR
ncbi:DNA polymerase kappa-like [Tropilaelaps mercedesae]|uniref:DNA polymerase kappa n=1 Tax=Tropilaelaps mercedesae TaxID=418985 RepID=A0A1V9Y2V3_9ACAR|nr:DNA polymerase kappa-like [Tropilaelaps mercedesae]